MGIIIRQSIKASVVTYAGVLIGAFNFLWLFPKCFDPAQIGLLQLVQGIAFVLAALAQLGSPNLVDKFFPDFADRTRNHQGLLFFSLLLPLVGIGLLAIWWLCFPAHWQSLFAEKSPEVTRYGTAILVLVVAIIYLTILEAYSRAHLRIVIPNLIREIGLRLTQSLLAIGFLTQHYGFEVVIYGVVAGYAVAVGALVGYLVALRVWYWRPDFRKFDRARLREMGIYAFFILVGGMGALVVARVDSLMLGALVGNYDLGIYATAFFMGTVIEIPRRMISQISLPLIGQAWKQNNLAQIGDIYRQSAINQLIVGGWVFLGIWTNVDDLFRLMPNGDTFATGRYVVLLIGLARLLDMATGVNGEIILQSRYYRFNMVSIALLALLLVGTNWLLIPALGIVGAALGTCLSIALYNVVKLGFLWWKVGLQPFSHSTWQVALLLVAGVGLGQLVPGGDGTLLPTLALIALRSVLLTLFLGGMVLWWKPSAEMAGLWRRVFGREKTAR